VDEASSSGTSEVRHVRQSTSEYEMMDPFELTKNISTPLTPLNNSHRQLNQKQTNEDLTQRLDRIQQIKEQVTAQEKTQIKSYLNVLNEIEKQVTYNLSNLEF
jgi:hypothetical protein